MEERTQELAVARSTSTEITTQQLDQQTQREEQRKELENQLTLLEKQLTVVRAGEAVEGSISPLLLSSPTYLYLTLPCPNLRSPVLIT